MQSVVSSPCECISEIQQDVFSAGSLYKDLEYMVIDIVIAKQDLMSGSDHVEP